MTRRLNPWMKISSPEMVKTMNRFFNRDDNWKWAGEKNDWIGKVSEQGMIILTW